MAVAEAHHHDKARAQEYFDKIFRVLPDISDLSTLQYMFCNSVTFLLTTQVTPANLEKVENLGEMCLKRAQVTGNELVLAQVQLAMAKLITHLVASSYYTSVANLIPNLEAKVVGPGPMALMRSVSVTNLSHFQQVQQRQQLLQHKQQPEPKTDTVIVLDGHTTKVRYFLRYAG